MLPYNKKSSLVGNLIAYIAIITVPFYVYANQDIKAELLKKIEAGIPEWMNRQISQDLAHAPKNGISIEAIEKTWSSNTFALALYRIKNGEVSLHAKPGMIDYAKTTLCEPFFNFLKELSTYVKLPDVEFLHFVWDSPSTQENADKFNTPHIIFSNYEIPVFASCKIVDEKNVVLVPDGLTITFIKDGSLEKTKLGNATYPWEQKIPQAIWRGQTTGGAFFMGIYDRFPRFKLVELSSKYPKILDAKFNSLWTDGYVKQMLEQLNYIGNTLSIEDHMKYKYQIMIDGNSAPWTRGFWQLHSNSVIFKQESNYIQWYYNELKPYVHYIPFSYFCEDLIEQLTWAQNNEDKVLEIINNANTMAAACLTYSDLLLYMYAVIMKYAELPSKTRA